MTRTDQISDSPRPLVRSREEMEETYRQIVACDPREGPAIVDTHGRLISMLDEMIERRTRRRQ